MARTQIDKSLVGSVSSSAVVGTTTNDNAPTGYVGQYIEASISGVQFTSGQWKDIASVSLTAGDWDVHIDCTSGCNSSSNWSEYHIGFGTSTGNVTPSYGQNYWIAPAAVSGVNSQSLHFSRRVSLSSTTTIYAKGYAVWGGTNVQTQDGLLIARRVR